MFAIDVSGNIYIADQGNNRIREVNTLGIITTIAGIGVGGFSGDGGSAASCELNGPTSVAVDGSGNIFISDYGNFKIRKIDNLGIITTVAGNGLAGYGGDGGPATAAEFNGAYTINLDVAGNLYIAEFNGSRVRKVTTSGIITTVAGNGIGGFSGDGGLATAAEIYNANGVTVDASGNIYIADWTSHRVRKVATTGKISTVAGDGVLGFSGDGGPATSAELSSPSSIAIDASNNIYIADWNQRIRTFYNGFSSYSYRWTPSGGTNLTASNLSAGTYTITATDAHGCTASASVAITQPVGFSVTATVTSNITCNGLTNGSASSAVTGGAAPYTYLWTGGGTTAIISGLSAGSYTLNVTDNNSACAVATIIITQPSALNASAGFTNVSCNGANDGVATSSVGGGTLPYSYLWTGGGTTAILTGLSAGTYNLNVTDGNGCTATASVSLTQPASAVTVSIASHTSPTCNGGLGSAAADSATGGAPYPIDSMFINTIAGIGIAGYNGDGIPANTAELSTPVMSALDKSGNIFIADFNGQRIREINKSTGLISTVAGNGVYGFYGDGGSATAAELAYPEGVAVDDSGNIYIADLNNERIRKVNTSGIITTIAGNGIQGYFGDGGPASAAEFNATRDVAVDNSGNVFISDCSNNRIRKVSTSGIVTTVAGTGAGAYNGDNIAATSAYINSPLGVTVDASGNIYIADDLNARVREVDALGIIHTIAGNGIAGFSGDGGNAASAELNAPFKAVADGSGNVLIADEFNNRIRTINSSGVIKTVAGFGYAGYGGDGGPAVLAELYNPTCVAVDGSGNLVITDQLNDRIREVKGFNNSYTYNWTPNGGSNLTASNLSAGTYTITATDSRGCNATASVSITEPLAPIVTASVITNVACNGENNGSARCSASGGLHPYTYSWTGGGTTSTVSGLSAGIYTIEVTDHNGVCGVGVVTITQPLLLTASVPFTNIQCSGFKDGSASAAVNGGTPSYTYLWTGGSTNSSISGLSPGEYTLKVTDKQGCTVTSSVSLTQPAIPLVITIASQTNVPCYGGTGSASASVPSGGSPYRIITTIAGNGIVGYSGDGGAATAAEMNTVEGISLDNSGSVYVADLTNNRIRKINTAGIISTIAGNGIAGFFGDGGPATAAEINNALTTAVDGLDNIYIADQLNERIRMINTSGIINSIAGNGIGGYSGDGGQATAAELKAKTCVSVEHSRNIYIADFTKKRRRKVNTSGIISTVAGNGTAGYSGDGGQATAAEINSPDGVYVDGSGNIFIADQVNNRVRKINTAGIISTIAGTGTGGYNGDGIAATSAEINAPKRVTTDGLGNVYFSDELNNRIRQVDLSGLISTIAGNGTQGYSGDGGSANSAEIFNPIGVAVDAAGSIYIGDKLNNVIRKVIPEYTYQWTPTGGTNLIASNLSPGSYTITATDLNGCSATASATITQPALLEGSTFVVTNVTCNGAFSGTVSCSQSGGSLPYTYSWTGGGTTATVSGLSAGTYSLTISDNHGCSVTGNTTITQPPALIATATTTSNESCYGDSSGSASSTISGGVPSYSYLWTGGGTNTTLTGLSFGTYSLTVTDKNGCVATTSATITQPANPLTITIAAVQNVKCNGGTGWTTANAPTGGTAPYIFYWSPSGGTNLHAGGLSAGTYTIIAIDAHLCFTTAAITITEPNPLLANTSVIANVNCIVGNDGSGMVNTTGGTLPYTYSWSNGGTTSTLTGLTAGLYTVTITDSNSCSTTASLTITQPIALRDSISISSNITCNNANNGSASVGVKGGTLPYTYLWSPSGKTTATINALSALTYTVSVTDFCANSATASVTITQPDPFLISIASHNNVLCNGGTSGSITADSATGGTKPYSYIWSPTGGSNLTANGLKDTVYTITVTDANGCKAFASITLTQPTSLSVSSAVSSNVSCYAGNNGSGSVTVSGGTIPYTYLWSNAFTTANINGAGAGTYTVNVIDANGCTITDSVTITQPPQLNVSSVVKRNIYCNDSSSGVVNSIASGGTPPYTYLWTGGQTTVEVTGLVAGTYTISVTDNNSCTVTATATIIQTSAMTIKRDSADDNGTCTGVAGVNVSGGTKPYTYLWAPGNQTTDSISGVCAGIYCCHVTDSNDCQQDICITIKSTVGIENIGNFSSIRIYPDPNTGYFVVTGVSRGQVIELYNSLGQKLSTDIATSDNILRFDISSKPDGIYLIRIQNKDCSEIFLKKIIKTQ